MIKKTTLVSILALAILGTTGGVGSVKAYANDAHTCTYTNGICETLTGETHYQEATDLDSDGTYEIGNAGQLYWFAAFVNAYPDLAANAELTANIVVNEGVLLDGELNVAEKENFRTWTPIGTYNSPYIGTFDGQGFTVSGVYYPKDADTIMRRGIFGTIGESGVVKNLGNLNSYIESTVSAAGIVGFNNGGTVLNCYNESRIAFGNYVGGIVAFNNGLIENCYNTGKITQDEVRFSYGAGGIVGAGNNSAPSELKNCYNVGTVQGTHNYTGAIIGNPTGAKITNCYYLADTATDGDGVTQYGVGNQTKGQTTPDAEGQTKRFASADEIHRARFFDGVDSYTYVKVLEKKIAETDRASTEKLQSLQSEIQLLQLALSAANGKIDELENTTGELAQKNEELQQAVNAANGKIDELTQKNEELRQAVNDGEQSTVTVELILSIVALAGAAATAVFVFVKKKKE